MRVAFVAQRCGREVNGGAELHCLQVAQRMAAYWQTEVLTTCALDYMTWDNSYPAGTEIVRGTLIRRFPVDRSRDVTSFNALSDRLRAKQPDATMDEQEEWMRSQGPVSTPLLDYLAANRNSYDAFIFFGYLYATTYFGLPVVEDKAYLAPLAHDEWPIYFTMWDALFRRPRQFIFNSQAERDFLRDRFPNHDLPGEVIAVGVDPPANARPEEFRQHYDLHGPFLLYVGRIDQSKGCDELIEYFKRARRDEAIPHKLLLVGKEVMPVPFDDAIVSLGFVNDEEKWNAMAACDWFVMPSPHESLSIALLEAWQMERPALVNGKCDVLRAQCQMSNGGLWYHSYREWQAAITCIDEATKRQLGRQGRRYVAARYGWDRVEEAYRKLLG